MKKFLVFTVIFAAMLLVSCDGDSKSENKNEIPDSADTVSDEDSGTADTGSSDTEPNEKPDPDSGDSTPEQPDGGNTTPEQPDSGDSAGDSDTPDSGNDADPADSGDDSGDSQPDTSDSIDDSDTSDSGDSTPDEDADTAPAIPECSGEASTFPCIDPEFGLVWSSVHDEELRQELAVSHCKDINDGGFTDWRLPTIDELRTLIKNSPETTFGGSCKVTDPGCRAEQCSTSSKCSPVSANDETGLYSKLGDHDTFWSSSVQSDNADNGWTVGFNMAAVSSQYNRIKLGVRCVRGNFKIKNQNACLPNPCSTVKYSTGKCTLSGTSGYSCECDANSTWNGEDCAIPECFTSIKTPCVDPNGTTWSKKNLGLTTYDAAESFCENLTEGGYSDWKLPDIDQLRSLIQNCSATEAGSPSCKISLENNCISSFSECPCGQYCDLDSSGTYSKFGDTAYLWSSTETATTNIYWVINFYSAAFVNNDKESGSNEYGARCVR